jgi:uncharacterized protein DUF4189
MHMRALAPTIVLALAATASPALAQDWAIYAAPEEGIAVLAPGMPHVDRKDFDARTMASLRNYTCPRSAGGAFLLGVSFRTGAAMAQTPPAAVIREQMMEAKRSCQEIRDEQPLDVPGGMGMEFVIDKCPEQVALKGRVYVIEDRMIAVAVVGSSGVEQLADTQKFLDSIRLTPVVPAEWKTYTARDDNFSIELPARVTVKEGGFHPNTYVSGRVIEAETRFADYAVSAAIRRRDGMTTVPNEQLLAHLLQDLRGDCELRQQRLSIAGGIGAEFVKEKCPGGTVLKGRLYLVDDRLYQLVAAWPGGPEPAEASRFLETFRLLMAAAPATPTVPEPAPQWQSLVSTDDGFSIEFPGRAQPVEAKLDAQTMLSNRQYMLDQGEKAWIVTATQFRPGRAIADDAWLTAIMGAIKGQCALRDDRRTGFPGGMALDFVVDKCPDGDMPKRVRLYALGDRLYQAIVAGPPGQDGKPETQKFFDSFKLTTLTSATPAAPQRSASAAPAAPSAEAGVSGVFENAMKRFPDSGAEAGSARSEPRQRQAAAPPAAREPAANLNWGALAIDVADSDPSYGVGGGDSESKAGDNAMRFCRRAGGKTCKVVVTYNQCAAYAASRRNTGSGKGATQKEAEAQALQVCNDRCRIVVSDCN